MLGDQGQRLGSRSERGFTLFELLVALTITVIGLAGLLSLHMSTVRGNATNGASGEAIALAQDSMEELRSKSVAQIQTDHFYGEVANGTLKCSGSTDTACGGSADTNIADTTGRASTVFRQRYTIIQVAPNLVTLGVEIYWSDDGADPPSPSLWANPRDGHRIAIELVKSRSDGL